MFAQINRADELSSHLSPNGLFILYRFKYVVNNAAAAILAEADISCLELPCESINNELVTPVGVENLQLICRKFRFYEGY